MGLFKSKSERQSSARSRYKEAKNGGGIWFSFRRTLSRNDSKLEKRKMNQIIETVVEIRQKIRTGNIKPEETDKYARDLASYSQKLDALKLQKSEIQTAQTFICSVTEELLHQETVAPVRSSTNSSDKLPSPKTEMSKLNDTKIFDIMDKLKYFRNDITRIEGTNDRKRVNFLSKSIKEFKETISNNQDLSQEEKIRCETEVQLLCEKLREINKRWVEGSDTSHLEKMKKNDVESQILESDRKFTMEPSISYEYEKDSKNDLRQSSQGSSSDGELKENGLKINEELKVFSTTEDRNQNMPLDNYYNVVHEESGKMKGSMKNQENLNLRAPTQNPNLTKQEKAQRDIEVEKITRTGFIKTQTQDQSNLKYEQNNSEDFYSLVTSHQQVSSDFFRKSNPINKGVKEKNNREETSHLDYVDSTTKDRNQNVAVDNYSFVHEESVKLRRSMKSQENLNLRAPTQNPNLTEHSAEEKARSEIEAEKATRTGFIKTQTQDQSNLKHEQNNSEDFNLLFTSLQQESFNFVGNSNPRNKEVEEKNTGEESSHLEYVESSGCDRINRKFGLSNEDTDKNQEESMEINTLEMEMCQTGDEKMEWSSNTSLEEVHLHQPSETSFKSYYRELSQNQSGIHLEEKVEGHRKIQVSQNPFYALGKAEAIEKCEENHSPDGSFGYKFNSNLEREEKYTERDETDEVTQEEELQILDIHQYFRNDLDFKSLDSLEFAERINTIKDYAETFENKVNNFEGEKSSLDYFVLDEKLMRMIENLDKIKSYKDPAATSRKVEVIEYIKNLQDTLDKQAKDD